MDTIILRTPPCARFHFGEVGGRADQNNLGSSSTFIHADTLFSALVNAWSYSHPDTVEMFINAVDSALFSLSSAYLMLEQKQTKERLFFLPKPVVLNILQETDIKKLDLKQFKKVQMLSLGVLQRGIPPAQWFAKDGPCVAIQNGNFIALKTEIHRSLELYSLQSTQKVQIRAEETETYIQTDLHLNNLPDFEIAWFFFVRIQEDPQIKSLFEAALNTLIGLGIGGERSTGCGSLSGFEWTKVNHSLPETAWRHSLSLVFPESEDADALYTVIKRGGRRLNGVRQLPLVQAMAEGMVSKGLLKGKLVELSHDPKILRYGKSFNIPLHQNYIKPL